MGLTGKEILPGEIWIVPDSEVIFPEAKLPGFEAAEHKTRPVIILSCQEDCKDPQIITVLTCPLTTRTDIVIQTDFFLTPTPGGVERESLSHLGHTQPILKSALLEKKGRLPKEQFEEIRTVLLITFGFLPRPKS